MKYVDSLARFLKQSYGRKFLLVILTLFIASVLVWFAKIGDSIYRDIIFTVVAVYISGNVFQKKYEAEIGKRISDGSSD